MPKNVEYSPEYTWKRSTTPCKGSLPEFNWRQTCLHEEVHQGACS